VVAGVSDLFVVNLDGSGLTNLTNDAAGERSPAWSLVGEYIAFVSSEDSNPEVYLINSDGTGRLRLTNQVGLDDDPAWQPAR
jgi:TolB protein